MGARRRFAVLCAILLAAARGGASGDAARTGDDALPRSDDDDVRIGGTAESSFDRSPAVFAVRRRESPSTPTALAHLREHDAHRRRRILESPAESPGASTFPLHGSVKEHGYYYANIALGDPSPRTFQVIVDTGSTLTYVPCATCAKCGTHTGGTRFDPTGKWLTCQEKQCKAAGGPGICAGGRGAAANRCTYSRTYAEGSGVSGDLVRDKMHFGGDIAPATNGTLDVVFGCTNAESGTIHDQEADGLIGLGNNQFASIPNQLADTHGLPRVFSLCFGSFEGGGALSFGRLPATPHTPPLVYTDMRVNEAHPAYYVVSTTAMKIGDVAVATPSDLAVGYGTVMDSGTTFTYVPTKVFHATAAALDAAVTTNAKPEKKLAKVPGPDPSYPDDVCFQREGATEIEPIVTMANLGEYYPPLTIAFDGEGASLVLPPSNYLFVHGKKPGTFCLGIMDNKQQGTLIGGISVRDVLVEYDKTVGGGRIGFAATDCDALLRDQLARLAGGDAGRSDPVVNEAPAPPPPGESPPAPKNGSSAVTPGSEKNDVEARTNNAYDYDEAEAGGYVLAFILCVACAGACYARCVADPSKRRGVELPYLGEVRFFRWGDSGYVEVDGEDEERGGGGGVLGGGMGRRGGGGGGGVQLTSVSSSLD